MSSTAAKVKKARKRADLGTKWVFTYWLGMEKDGIDGIAKSLSETLALKVDKYVFQLEQAPETGRYHMQAWMERKKPFRAIERFKGTMLEGTHFEMQRAADFNARGYCCKPASKIEGPWANFDTDHAVANELYRELPVVREMELYPWQKMVWDLTMELPDDRVVYWFYDQMGGAGKSYLVKKMCEEPGVCRVGGRGKDCAFAIKKYIEEHKQGARVVLWDVARSAGEIDYMMLEKIKNGCVFSAKYESSSVRWASPHVVVFSNYPPLRYKLSEDRWRVYEISNGDAIRIGQ